jgi:membrane protease YdiL (CAAX protease family)
VSARLEAVRSRAPLEEAVGAAVVLAGLAILVARPFVVASPPARVTLFAGAYVAIGAVAMVLPLPREVRGPGRSVAGALALGVAAVAVAAVVAGRPVPAPTSAAALPLSLLAAVAEEALFRRVAYGRLVRLGAALAIGVTAVLFALVHLPAYGVTALPVDLGAGLLLSWQRWASGTWTVPAATHGFANILAVLR